MLQHTFLVLKSVGWYQTLKNLNGSSDFNFFYYGLPLKPYSSYLVWMPWRHPAEPFSDAIIRGFTSALCAARLIFCNMHRLQLTIYMQLTVCSIITYPTYYRQLPPFIFHSDLRFPCLASLCCFTYLHLHIQVREGAKKLVFSRNIS